MKYLSRSFTLDLSATDGSYTLYGDDRFYREEHMHKRGLDAPGKATGAMSVVGLTVKRRGVLREVYEDIDPLNLHGVPPNGLSSLLLSQDQIRQAIDSGRLGITSYCQALFLATAGDEPIGDDATKIFIIAVVRSPNGTVVVHARKWAGALSEEPAMSDILPLSCQIVVPLAAVPSFWRRLVGITLKGPSSLAPRNLWRRLFLRLAPAFVFVAMLFGRVIHVHLHGGY